MTVLPDGSAARREGALPMARPSAQLTRRQFLGWSVLAGAAAALPFAWSDAERTVKLGFVGLGERGRAALASALALPRVSVAALCDRERGLATEAAATLGLSTALGREAEQMLRLPAVDAWVLAAAAGDQLELARQALGASSNVFLLRPFPVESTALPSLLALAAERRRQIQIGRATRFSLESGAARTLVAGDGDRVTHAMIAARLLLPTVPDSDLAGAELVDELDLALAMLAAEPVRKQRVVHRGDRGVDLRLQLALRDEQGRRSQLALTLRAAATAERHRKESVIRLVGPRGTAHVTGAASPAELAADLALFLHAVRTGDGTAALSLSRLLDLLAHLHH
jgi:predicted dehydrogenase